MEKYKNFDEYINDKCYSVEEVVVDNPYKDLVKSLKKLGVHDPAIIPADNPAKGKFGHVLFWYDKHYEEGEDNYCSSEQNFFICRSVWPEADVVDFNDIEDYKKAFEEALENDWFMVKADDPMKHKLGFIVVKASGTTCYRIHFSEIKKYNATENK